MATDRHANLHRLPVKPVRHDDGVVKLHTKSQHTNSTGNVYQVYEEEVAVFLVYTHELERLPLVYIYQFDKQSSRRVDEPDQPDPSSNWADDYRFDEQ